MGLKDFFGGDKKKAEFREKVSEAVSDGKITPERIAQLEALRQELHTGALSEEKTQIRRGVFNNAVENVKAGGKLTPQQADELAKVQKFLALRDDQVDKTRMDLAHLRKMTDIRSGPLPTVSADNTAMRGVPLESGETAHYCTAADFFSTEDPKVKGGHHVVGGETYRPGASAGHVLPVKGATPMGEGFFIITNQRFLLKGGRVVGYPLKQPEDVHVYQDGLRLNFRKRQILIHFRASNIADVAGTMLTRLLK